MQVASYIRAVLRTVAQCHSHRILHRDVKPGNFMLLNDSPHAPLKAIGALTVLTCTKSKSTCTLKSCAVICR